MLFYSVRTSKLRSEYFAVWTSEKGAGLYTFYAAAYTFLMVYVQLHIIIPGCHKLMVCVQFFSSAIALLRRKFHVACYFRELDTIALYFKIVSHLNFPEILSVGSSCRYHPFKMVLQVIFCFVQ